MANLRIGYLNHADAATITATPTLTTAGPTSYLQNDARGLIAQASSTASQVITGTWGGTAYTVSELCLWRHNLAYNDTVRLELFSDAAWTTGVYDSTALAAYASGLFTDWGWAFSNRYFAATSCKSFKITIAASASAFECARLYLGPYTEAPVQAGEGLIITQETNARQSRSEGGSLRSIVKADWRSMAFEMMVGTEAYRAAWYEISRYCGISKSFVASLDPGGGGTLERDGTVFGKFERAPGMKLGTNRYDFSMKILEL